MRRIVSLTAAAAVMLSMVIAAVAADFDPYSIMIGYDAMPEGTV